jgi:hypothetical protein
MQITLGARDGSPNIETGREPTAVAVDEQFTVLEPLFAQGLEGDLPAEPKLPPPVPELSRLNIR